MQAAASLFDPGPQKSSVGHSQKLPPGTQEWQPIERGGRGGTGGRGGRRGREGERRGRRGREEREEREGGEEEREGGNQEREEGREELNYISAHKTLGERKLYQ